MFTAMPPVFAGLTPSESQEAAHLLQQVEVPTGEAIMMEGENDQTLAFIGKGSVEVWMGETRVGIAGARDMLGEMELFYPMPRACSVTASHDTILQIFTPEAFTELCNRNNPVVYNIERYAIRRLSDRLATLNREITSRSEGGGLLHFDRSEPGLLARLFKGRQNKVVSREPIDVLMDSDMFNWADSHMVAAVAEHFEPVTFEKDHIICEQGEESDEMWIIDQGEVEVVLVTDEDEDTGETVGRLGPGHAFGDASIAMQGERTATCVARTAVAALQMEREKYLGLHDSNDPIGSTFRQAMIRNLIVHLLTTTRRFVALQPSLAPPKADVGSDVWR